MTDTTTAPTAEECVKAAIREWLAAGRLAAILDNPALLEKEVAAAIRQHSAPLEAQIAELTAENEQLRIMADEPTTKRVWDGIQAMACLFSDPDHMPTVLEFKAAFDAAFVIDGKPYDVERIKAEWQADYAAMEARATTAEAALAASQERERVMREALERIADPGGPKSRGLSFLEMRATARAALQPKEPANAHRG